MSASQNNIANELKSINNKSKILNSITLSMINVLLLLVFFYNLFSQNYLPNQGTGILFSIITGLTLIFIIINIFIRNISLNQVTNVLGSIKDKALGTNTQSQENIMKKIGLDTELLIFRILNSIKMLFITIICILLSIIFFRYDKNINAYHANIPSFDTFFMVLVFSLVAQTIYITTGHFTYNASETIQKYFGTSVTSFLTFTILNVINLFFVMAMYSELRFSITDG